MEPGEYYVGDLCYVMGEEWDEFCSLTLRDGECLNGEFSLADGRKFAFSSTAFGDGSYPDQYGNHYDVDAGLIGCIKVSDINRSVTPEEIRRSGQIFTFKEPFTVNGIGTGDRWDGIIEIGHVLIDTNPNGEEDEEDTDNCDFEG